MADAPNLPLQDGSALVGGGQAVCPAEVAQAQADAVQARGLLRDELGAQFTIVERRADAVEAQDRTAIAEYRSAKGEADELSQSRLQHDLEA